MDGYTKSYRKKFDNKLFRGQKFCRGYAFDWLIAAAAFKPYEIEIRGKNVVIDRGQLTHSIRFIADKWHWDKSAVSRFLTRLKTDTMIETATDTGQLIITICNYDLYQGNDLDGETQSKTVSETKLRQQRDKEEEGKEDISGEKDLFGSKPKLPKPLPKKPQIEIDFEEFFENYPKRPGNAKPPALNRYKQARKKGASKEQLVAAAQAYARSRAGEDPQYTMKANNWLREAMWDTFSGTGTGELDDSQRNLLKQGIIPPSMKSKFEASGLNERDFAQEVFRGKL